MIELLESVLYGCVLIVGIMLALVVIACLAKALTTIIEEFKE